MPTWRAGDASDWTSAEGSPAAVADAVVAGLEAEWTPERIGSFLDGLPTSAGSRSHAVNRLARLVEGRDLVLFDGGMGTLLQERGLDDGGCGELWNVEHPDVVAGDPRGVRRRRRHDPDHQHIRRHPAAAGDEWARATGWWS